MRAKWWTWSGSNRRPPACHAGALPAELQARYIYYSKYLGPFVENKLLFIKILCNLFLYLSSENHPLDKFKKTVILLYG